MESLLLVISVARFHIYDPVQTKLREERTRFALALLFHLTRRLSGLESLLLVDSIPKFHIQVPVYQITTRMAARCFSVAISTYPPLIRLWHRFYRSMVLANLSSTSSCMVSCIGLRRAAIGFQDSPSFHQLPIMSFISEGKPEAGAVKIPSRDD